MKQDKIAKTESIISKEYSNIAGMVVMKSIISILYGMALDKGYLDGGVRNGNRIVSEKWIIGSTSEQSRWKRHGLPYGSLIL